MKKVSIFALCGVASITAYEKIVEVNYIDNPISAQKEQEQKRAVEKLS